MISRPDLWFQTICHKQKRIIKNMSLLSYLELVDLVNDGVINAPMSAVNGSSIDLTLHHLVRKEVIGSTMRKVRLAQRESIDTVELDITGGYIMLPDTVLLASTNERFNLPLWLSAEFSLKSTLGRNFLGHELAGWIDAGFDGCVTLELKNNTQFHKLIIEPDMKIGQVKFFRHAPVPEDYSYKHRGQYNGQEKVTASKGLR